MKPEPLRPSYGFELYSRSIARRCVQVLTKRFGPAEQIEGLWILRDHPAYWPNMLLVRHRGLTGSMDEELTFEPSRAGSDLPDNVSESDPVLDFFGNRFPEVKDRLCLNSRTQIPGLLLEIARAQCKSTLRRELASSGFAVPPANRFFFATYDETGEIREEAAEEDLWNLVRGELKSVRDWQVFLAELASISYAGVPERLGFLSWAEQL